MLVLLFLGIHQMHQICWNNLHVWKAAAVGGLTNCKFPRSEELCEKFDFVDVTADMMMRRKRHVIHRAEYLPAWTCHMSHCKYPAMTTHRSIFENEIDILSLYCLHRMIDWYKISKCGLPWQACNSQSQSTTVSNKFIIIGCWLYWWFTYLAGSEKAIFMPLIESLMLYFMRYYAWR